MTRAALLAGLMSALLSLGAARACAQASGAYVVLAPCAHGDERLRSMIAMELRSSWRALQPPDALMDGDSVMDVGREICSEDAQRVPLSVRRVGGRESTRVLDLGRARGEARRRALALAVAEWMRWARETSDDTQPGEERARSDDGETEHAREDAESARDEMERGRDDAETASAVLEVRDEAAERDDVEHERETPREEPALTARPEARVARGPVDAAPSAGMPADALGVPITPRRDARWTIEPSAEGRLYSAPLTWLAGGRVGLGVELPDELLALQADFVALGGDVEQSSSAASALHVGGALGGALSLVRASGFRLALGARAEPEFGRVAGRGRM